MNYNPYESVFVFGEVLFDIFGDKEKMGGAPFNVAYNLQMQDFYPYFVSRVGLDSLGGRIQNFIYNHDMHPQFVGADDELPTGSVTVTLADGEPVYDIKRNVAYDNIEFGGGAPDGFLYYGTLACRDHRSKSTLLKMLEGNATTFYDVNLRDGWTPELVSELACHADYIKLNADELKVLSGSEEIAAGARAMLAKYDIKEAYITCGADGAMCITPDDVLRSVGYAVADMVDTVGAGDAFSSVIIGSLILGEDRLKALNKAAYYAAKICSLQGALTSDRYFYSKIQEEMNEIFG